MQKWQLLKVTNLISSFKDMSPNHEKEHVIMCTTVRLQKGRLNTHGIVDILKIRK